MSQVKVENVNDTSIASRKLAAAELRKARKVIRDPRSRLFSDSTDEAPKGILKHTRLPTKRSASECVDDLSIIMANLQLNFDDLPKNTVRYCPIHQSYFKEEDEDDEDDEDGLNRNEEDNDEEDEDPDQQEQFNQGGDTPTNEKKLTSGNTTGDAVKQQHLTRCDCLLRYSDSSDSSNNNHEKPKKSVRFNDKVYETFFFAARLYDRRSLVKYHSSTRHHPPMNQSGKTTKPDKQACRQTKSQRAKQSKKDKKKGRLNKREESSDDQGYCSSIHSFSD